jgi:hypothetical protein
MNEKNISCSDIRLIFNKIVFFAIGSRNVDITDVLTTVIYLTDHIV